MDGSEEHSSEGRGLGGTLRRLGDTLLSTLHNRVQLLGVELEEERAWLISTLIWTAAAVFLSGLTVVLVVITAVWLSPESARPWVLVGFTAIFTLLSVNSIACLRRQITTKPPPFAATGAELKKDIEWIRSRD